MNLIVPQGWMLQINHRQDGKYHSRLSRSCCPNLRGKYPSFVAESVSPEDSLRQLLVSYLKWKESNH